MSSKRTWLFVSDVDDTLLGDTAALARLAEALKSASHLISAYNSSRPCASLRHTLATTPQLPAPDYLIGAMGTEIQDGKTGEPLTDYTQRLKQGWQRDRIAAIMKEMDFAAHPHEYQTPLKASYDVPSLAAYVQILHRLEATGLEAKVIYSGSQNVDIIPPGAGKGNVITYLRQRLRIQPEFVVVAGDSGNDLEMFVPPYKGIVVANAAPELKQQQSEYIYHAGESHAGGVLEGLRFWQVL